MGEAASNEVSMRSKASSRGGCIGRAWGVQLPGCAWMDNGGGGRRSKPEQREERTEDEPAVERLAERG
ncbi:hypothetical protein R1flu_028866 [Riccia fluitans]|uniref:Uncharacterized protein n=1 Tax=Riccia fluitans TaxID=41844 RepID=A0ABD1XNJ5_9MARC